MQRVRWGSRGTAPAGRFAARPATDTMSASDVRHAMHEGGKREKLDAIARLAERMERGAVAKCEAASILEGGLGDPDFDVRWRSALTIAKHGSVMLSAIGGGLGNDDPKIRMLMSKIACAVVSSNPGACSDYASAELRKLARALLVAMSDSQQTVAGYASVAIVELTGRNPVVVLEEADAVLRETKGGAPLERARERAVETLRAHAAGNEC